MQSPSSGEFGYAQPWRYVDSTNEEFNNDVARIAA